MFRKSDSIFDIKTIDENGIIEGYGSTFGGEPDSYGDIIEQGAFSKSLKDHKSNGTMPKILWQHDVKKPIGKWTEAVEDKKGLHVTGRLTMDSPQAQEAYALMKDGVVDRLSIGYRLKKYEKNEDDGTWLLKELDLQEISIVTFPANDNATINSVKAAKVAYEIQERLKAGDQLTEREFGIFLKGLGFSNSQAERAVRINLKGQWETANSENDMINFLTMLKG